MTRVALAVSLVIALCSACDEAEPPVCDEELIWQGDYVALEPADLQALVSYTRIAGDLTVSGSIETLSALACLEQIDGLLYLSQGELRSLEGLSHIADMGSLYISEMANLHSLEGLSSIRSLGSLTLQSSPVDSFAGLSGLETIAGTLHIHDNSTPAFSGLESLSSIGGNLVINGYSDALTLDGLSSLVSIGGSLDIQFGYGLTSMTGLSALQSVGGDLRVINNPSLAELGLSQLVSLAGNLTVRINAMLPNCQALALQDRLLTGGWSGEAIVGSNADALCN